MFSWSYVKDGSTSEGDDLGVVDAILVMGAEGNGKISPVVPTVVPDGIILWSELRDHPSKGI